MCTRAKKQRNQRKNHLVSEVLAEEEHAKHSLNRDNAENRHRVLNDLQHLSEFLDVGRVLLDQMARKDVRPETIGALAKSHLKLDFVWLVSVSTKKVERVSEDGRAALNAIVEPRGSVLLLVQTYGSCLTTTDAHAFDHRDSEFLGMLCQGCSARLITLVSPDEPLRH